MVQAQTINKILHSKSLDLYWDNDLTVEHFGSNADEMQFILDHYEQYGNVPDIPTFLDKFSEFIVDNVSESDDYLISKLDEEYQYSQLVPIIQKAANIIQTDSIAACDYLKTALDEMNQRGGVCGVDIIANAQKRYDLYKKKHGSSDPWMLETGFKEIDAAIGGLAPGEEYAVIFARTNQGKSWVLCAMATHSWKCGYNVGYISPEMGDDLIGYRFDTLLAHFSNYALYTGSDVDGYEEHIKNLSGTNKNKFIVATPAHFNRRITVSKLRRFVRQNKLDILCIDGIKYLSDERYKRGDNTTTSLTNISEDLMSLSCELGIPIVAVVQANREGVSESGDAPALETIRDSDGIAQNASKVFSISQKDSKLNIKIVKCRTGKVGLKFCYDWDIDTGKLTYTTEGTESPQVANRQKQQVENKQPLRRLERAVIPF